MNIWLEFGEVEIAPDLNEKVADTAHKIVRARIEYARYPDKAEKIVAALQEEFRLYYVAVTRGMLVLTNAVHLGRGLIA